jgi:ribosome-binding factor A
LLWLSAPCTFAGRNIGLDFSTRCFPVAPESIDEPSLQSDKHGHLFWPALKQFVIRPTRNIYPMAKHRLERVNEVIKRELGDLIHRELTFEAKLVTVQQVDITPDLKHAHVFISVIGTDPERRKAMSLLHSKRIPLQQSLSKRIILKFTPNLHFKLDEAVERGTRILTILEELELPPLDEGAEGKKPVDDHG